MGENIVSDNVSRVEHGTSVSEGELDAVICEFGLGDCTTAPPNCQPEVLLALAVVAMARFDALGIHTGVKGDSKEEVEILKRMYQEDGEKFCTSLHEGWRQSREDWCGIAGIDPDALRNEVLDSLAPGVIGP